MAELLQLRLPEPVAKEPFSVTSEVSACPWNSSHRLLRLGLKSQRISQAETPARNLVFLLDVSGSMMPENKLPLLKRGLSLLAENLRPKDTDFDRGLRRRLGPGVACDERCRARACSMR